MGAVSIRPAVSDTAGVSDTDGRIRIRIIFGIRPGRIRPYPYEAVSDRIMAVSIFHRIRMAVSISLKNSGGCTKFLCNFAQIFCRFKKVMVATAPSFDPRFKTVLNEVKKEAGCQCILSRTLAVSWPYQNPTWPYQAVSVRIRIRINLGIRPGRISPYPYQAVSGRIRIRISSEGYGPHRWIDTGYGYTRIDTGMIIQYGYYVIRVAHQAAYNHIEEHLVR